MSNTKPVNKPTGTPQERTEQIPITPKPNQPSKPGTTKPQR